MADSSKIRVLCADDDRMWSRMLGSWLRTWGYMPVMASDGKIACELLCSGDPPQIALLDWMMPGMSGVEICRTVRSQVQVRYTYMIIATGRTHKADLLSGLEAGADDYLAKPVNPQELERRLHCGRRIVELHQSLLQTCQDLELSIVAREQVESKLRNKQKLEAVGQLSAGVAHELNTPIQFIGDSIAFIADCIESKDRLLAAQRKVLSHQDVVAAHGEELEVLAELEDELDIEYLEEEGPEAIRRTLDGVERVSRIVRAMKNFSHHGAEEMSFCQLNRMLEDTAIVASNEYKFVADLKCEFAQIPEVICHSSDLGQVVLNLIVNAAHAIKDANERQGRSRGVLSLRSRQVDEDWVELSVADDGCGMSAETRERIFEPFFTTKAVGVGTGQGLAISHTIIVERHGGSITVESEVDVGTTFTIRLPVKGVQAEKQASAA